MLDPARWPDRLQTAVLTALLVVFIGLWMAGALVDIASRPVLAGCAVLYPALFGSLIWRFDRRPWRDIASWTVPLTALMAIAIAIAPVPLGLLLGWFSTAWLIVFISWLPPVAWWYRWILRKPLPPNYGTGWTELLPERFLREPRATKVVGDRIWAADDASARLIDDLMSGGDPVATVRAAARLADKARREARHRGTWQASWAAQAAWLGALTDYLSGPETEAGAARVNELGAAYGEAMRRGLARAKEIDPTLLERRKRE